MLIFISEFALILDVQNPDPSFYAVCWQLDFYSCQSSQPSLISICSNANFSPVSSPKSFSHMTIKRSQIMIKAHVLGLFHLCSPFWFPLDKLPTQGLEFLFLFFFSQQLWHCLAKYQTLFQKHSPKNSSDLLTNYQIWYQPRTPF